MSDWTADPSTGRSNSSPLFLELRDEVGRLIRDDAYTLIRGGATATAGVILAQLAHKHGFGPLGREVPCGSDASNMSVLHPEAGGRGLVLSTPDWERLSPADRERLMDELTRRSAEAGLAMLGQMLAGLGNGEGR